MTPDQVEARKKWIPIVVFFLGALITFFGAVCCAVMCVLTREGLMHADCSPLTALVLSGIFLILFILNLRDLLGSLNTP